MLGAAACYREYAPCEALRASVRAFFTFVVPRDESDKGGRRLRREIHFAPDEFYDSALFADGHLCLTFSFGAEYRIAGLWEQKRGGGHVIGPVRRGRPASHGPRVVQVGAYLRPTGARLVTAAPLHQLADRVVALCDVWAGRGSVVEEQLALACDDTQRLAVLEAALIEQAVRPPCRDTGVDVAGLTGLIRRSRGSVAVEDLASRAGVSRQHLRRIFNDEVGVTPKLYCRLARFQAALSQAASLEGAQLAAEAGYADQSHMIADFREFSSLTPHALIAQRRFHPFITRNI